MIHWKIGVRWFKKQITINKLTETVRYLTTNNKRGEKVPQKGELIRQDYNLSNVERIFKPIGL